MKFFKFGLILSAACLFAFACSQTSTNNNSKSVANTSSTITQNVNGTSVSYETAPDNSVANSQSGAPELAGARKIYAEKCVACHKENGEGGKFDQDGAGFNVPSYKSDRAKNKSDEKFLDYIENGDDDMPPFKGKISTEEMKLLVKMIRKDFQGK